MKNKFYEKINSILKIILHHKQFLIALITTISAFHIGSALAIDPSTDILSGAKADVQTNFGANSTFMFIMIFVDVVICSVAYMKTQNLMQLSGVIVLIIFVNFIMVIA